jgi:hypothetical protein
MTAPVKLDRWLGLALIAGAVGCVQQPVSPAGARARSSSPEPAVGTTQLTSASEELPRVGKPQYAEPDANIDEELPSKVEPARRERRPGGGFSGYK